MYFCLIKLGKVIKKILHILTFLLVAILLLLLGSYLLLQNVGTQKEILSEVTDGLSKKIDSKVTSGNIEWGFPNTFVLNDLYVEDQCQDTLLFVKRAKVTVNILPLLQHKISLRTVQLTQMRGYIHQDTAGVFNFQFVIDAFKKKDDTEKSKWMADIESVGFKDCSVSFHKDSVNATPFKFNPKFLDVDSINGHIYVRELSKDSINVKLHKLSFTEASGVNLSDLSTTIAANRHGLRFLHFTTSMPDSKVAFKNAEVSYSDINSKNFFHDYLLNLELEPSNVNLYDLRAFVPAFRKLNDDISLYGSVSGPIDNLKVRNLLVKNGNGLVLDGDVDLAGLPKIKDAYVRAKFRQVVVDADHVRHFGSAFINRDVYLPPAFEKMGFVSYVGDIEGSLASISADGAIGSGPGSIELNVDIDNPNSDFSKYSIDGELNTKNFHLAEILPTTGLGNTTLGLVVNLKRDPNAVHKFSVNADGVVDSLEYRGYTYHGITLNGDFGPKGFTGELQIDDPNAQFNLSGNVHLTQKKPEFHFTANAKRICLSPLNLTKNKDNSCLSFDIVADFQGKTFDELEGSFSLDNFLYQRPSSKDLMVNNVSLNVTPAKNGRKTATFYSDFINGNISGQYQLAGLVANTKKILRQYVPAVISSAVEKQSGNNFTFDFKINNTEVLTDVFKLPVAMVAEGSLKGYFNDVNGKFRMRLEAPMLRMGKNTLQDVLVLCENPKDEAKLVARGTMMPYKRRRNPYYFSVNANAKSDSISSRINFSNSVDETYSGELSVLTVLNSLTKEGLSADFFVRPTEFILKDSVWNVHESTVKLRPGMLNVRNFLVEHGDQELRINGISTRDMNDSIGVYLHDIRLGYISNMINNDRITFNGTTNGNVYVKRLFNKPYMYTNLKVDSVFMNSYQLASKLVVAGEFDTRDREIFFDADLTSHVSGAKSPIIGSILFNRDSMSIEGDLKDIDLRFIRTYVGGVMADFTGFATGKVRAFGHFGDIGLEGDPVASNVHFGVEFLNTEYFVDKEVVHMKHNSFEMRNGKAHDALSGTALVNAKVTHHGFQDMKFNVNVQCNNILALNTTEADNETFYGKAFGDGNIHIYGVPGSVNFEMKDLKTRENTVVTIPIGGTNDVENSDFITFVNDEERQTASEKKRNRRERIKQIQAEKNLKSRIKLDMQLSCTPDAQIQLIMDPRAGDIIRTRGNGVIHMTYDSQTSDFGMLGTYEVTKGDYLFTVQSIISRKFSILPGSQLHFTGSPYSAGLNVQAKYSLNASLSNILADDPTYSKISNANVDCLLYLTGNIQRPIIKFGLELPNSDEEVKRKLASIVNTEETLNRNVASLLALGHFYTMDKSSGQSGATGNSELSSVGFSTLSSEIGSLLSRINNDVNVGLNYNPGSEATATGQEFEVALSTQFLNDRLLVNGNFGYRENNMTTLDEPAGNSGIIDFDIEYKLNPSGKFRTKAFNRSDNSYFRQNSNGTTQGVGLIYREDFDTYSEWMNRYWHPVKSVFTRKKKKKQ